MAQRELIQQHECLSLAGKLQACITPPSIHPLVEVWQRLCADKWLMAQGTNTKMRKWWGFIHDFHQSWCLLADPYSRCLWISSLVILMECFWCKKFDVWPKAAQQFPGFQCTKEVKKTKNWRKNEPSCFHGGSQTINNFLSGDLKLQAGISCSYQSLQLLAWLWNILVLCGEDAA